MNSTCNKRFVAMVVAIIALTASMGSALAEELYLHCVFEHDPHNTVDFIVDMDHATFTWNIGDGCPNECSVRATPTELVLTRTIAGWNTVSYEINRMTGEFTFHNRSLVQWGTCQRIDQKKF